MINSLRSRPHFLAAAILVSTVTGDLVAQTVTGSIGGVVTDANGSAIRLGALSNDAPYNFKLGGTYKLPWNFLMSGNFQHISGYPIAQQYTVNSVNLLDLRFSRDFKIGERWKIQPQFDIYNLNNSAAVVSVNQSANSSALFLNPTAVLPPRIFKLGLRVDL